MSITTGPQQHQNANNSMSAKNRKDASHYTDINKIRDGHQQNFRFLTVCRVLKNFSLIKGKFLLRTWWVKGKGRTKSGQRYVIFQPYTVLSGRELIFF